MLTITNEDNILLMSRYPDKYFDLAIVDPPYAVGASDGTFGNKGVYSKRGKSLKHYANHDTVPDELYFKELFRVSKNQIIWGSNYYPQHLYHSGALIWDKNLTGSPMSDCEIAFQSFNKLVNKVKVEWNGFRKGIETGEQRIHPNQKPKGLYYHCLKTFGKVGDKILDTHLGSGTIACVIEDMPEMQFDLTACELDKDYYDSAMKRIDQHIRNNTKLSFDKPQENNSEQPTLF